MAQWLRRCITKPTVVGSILADATAVTDFVPFSKVLNLDCLFPTQGCAEAFNLQWIDTAWNVFLFFYAMLSYTKATMIELCKIGHYEAFLVIFKRAQS